MSLFSVVPICAIEAVLEGSATLAVLAAFQAGIGVGVGVVPYRAELAD
jgi:hypothetical protein